VTAPAAMGSIDSRRELSAITPYIICQCGPWCLLQLQKAELHITRGLLLYPPSCHDIYMYREASKINIKKGLNRSYLPLSATLAVARENTFGDV